MILTQSELLVLEQISLGKKDVTVVADLIGKSKPQTYIIYNKLVTKGILDVKYMPVNSTFVGTLLELLQDSPQLIKILADSGLPILISIIEEKTVAKIEKETGLGRAIIYRKLRAMRNVSIIRGNRLILNEKIWQELMEFAIELKKYEQTVDLKVPLGSTIYYKDKGSILFSNRFEIDATVTAFSVFERFGIKLLPVKYYYYLPKKKLTKKEVFIHALRITEKEHTIRNIIFVALFYFKYKRELSSVRHKILSNLRLILNHKRVERYPSLTEIKEKCELYDIQI